MFLPTDSCSYILIHLFTQNLLNGVEIKAMFLSSVCRQWNGIVDCMLRSITSVHLSSEEAKGSLNHWKWVSHVCHSKIVVRQNRRLGNKKFHEEPKFEQEEFLVGN